MKKYALLRSISAPGYREPNSIFAESDDIKTITDAFCKLVIDGCPPGCLRIVKNVSHEFKCAVKLIEEGE